MPAPTFPTNGLDATVAACKAGLAAKFLTTPSPAMRDAYIAGFAAGAHLGIPLDNTAAAYAALNTAMATDGKLQTAMALQVAYDAAAAESAADASVRPTRPVAATLTAATAAVNGYTP